MLSVPLRIDSESLVNVVLDETILIVLIHFTFQSNGTAIKVDGM